MTRDEQQALSTELSRAIGDGKPWVVFNDLPDKVLQPKDLHFFESAGAAEKFCDAASGDFDFAGQTFNWDNYKYMQATTLKAGLKLEAAESIKHDISAITRQMAEQNLFLMPGTSYEVFENVLSKGNIFPVTWLRSVDPIKEIAEYHVIAHQHNGGMVYETGHSHRLMETFSNLPDARTFMESAVLYNELADKGTDYLIVGRFHDERLELDIEGYAMPHSGLTLVTANHNFENGHEFHELQSLFEPAQIRQHFFAGVHEGALRLFNDRLEATTLGNPHPAFYATYFNQEYLTTKNSIIMNEQSFDYLKNQLFYLGFGEEIAKPLRALMEQNLTEFKLPYSRKFGQDEVNSVLHFSKGDDMVKDMTFFNRYDAALKQPGKEDLTQTFFVGKEYNYTLQERYNMMDGRAVYREQPVMRPVDENGETKMKPTGETYTAWKALNFKESDGYGNFLPKTMFWNHDKEVGKYPIKGIEDNYTKQRIINHLEKGNKADVTLLRNGVETLAKMVANPRMARLDFYNSDGQSLIVRKVQKQAVAESQKTELSPQEVQRAAIAKAAEHHQTTTATQQQSASAAVKGQTAVQQNENKGQVETQQQNQKETSKEQVSGDQKQENRRKQGIRI